MERITFIIPSRNNLEFLKLAYKSIKDLHTQHDILILDDASTDGTKAWLDNLEDTNLSIFYNPGPERIGIVGMFDEGIWMADTDIVIAFHADMVVCPDFDVAILKHLKRGTVVSATRVEPPLHPKGPEKITMGFGNEPEEFNMVEWNTVSNKLKEDKTTEGIFAPWCMYKDDFLAIGGHDPLFAPQSKEDSDLFNRFVLNGYKVIQSWEALVYHFTSRGSRFNKHAGGGAGVNSPEWIEQNSKSARNFIRKWGSFVSHDALMKPIIPPKYDIGLILDGDFPEYPLLNLLEPYFSNVYVSSPLREDYIKAEQPNTIIDLSYRIKPYDNEKNNEIFVTVNGPNFTQQDFDYITKLPLIIKDSGEKGRFKLGNIEVEIIQMNEYQNTLIKI